MTSLKSDSLNDFVITNNDLELINDVDEKTQILRENLKTFLGEWFLDLEIGAPYFQMVFKKNVDPVQIDSALKDVILSSKGVSELVSYDSTFGTGRTYSISFSVRFDNVVINFNEVLP